MLIDTHAHLCSEELFGRTEQIVRDFYEDGLEAVVCPSYDFISNHKTLEVVNNFDNVYGALGIHPNDSHCWDAGVRSFIEDNIDKPKIVAIGEVGLDYHYPEHNASEQRQILLQQLNIAKYHKMPVIFHVRDAWADFLEFIRTNRDLVPAGVIHCFDGDENLAREILDLGFSISVTGLVTYKKAKLIDAVRFIPIERLMLETDSPYLVPHNAHTQQKINEPKFVQYVADAVAEIKQMRVEKVIEHTTQNAYNFFKKLRTNNE